MGESSLSDIVAAEQRYLTEDILQAPSMLSYDERALLHWAAREGRPREGSIIDAGSFLGGSTTSLARGLSARDVDGRDVKVHAYDLFRFGAEFEKHWVPSDMDFAIGDSSIPVFERTTRNVADRIVVHAGDIRQVRWHGDPIAVLFVDIAKAWSTSDHVTRTFFPSLVPGESLVVQQDQVHWGHPWCAITMELLADRFEYLGWVWFSSAVYRCVAPVQASDLPASVLHDISPDGQLALLDRFADRIGSPGSRFIRLSGAVVLASHDHFDEARGRVAEVRADVGDEEVPYLAEGLDYLVPWIDDVAAGRVPIE